MSEMSSRFDWFCQLTAERLAQASGNAPGTSETGVGLLPLNLVDEHELRMALDALGVVPDAEPLCLIDPRWWGNRVPPKPKLTPDVSLLSTHQWSRYGKGKRAGPAVTHVKVVAAMAHRRLPLSIHVTTVNSRMNLLDDLAVSEEIRHYPDHERSTNSTGMW